MEFTFDPTIDFANSSDLMDMYVAYHKPILLQIHRQMHVLVNPHDLADCVRENPKWYVLDLFDRFYPARYLKIIEEVNNAHFNGENVLFNNIDKLKESEWFNLLLGIYEYLGSNPKVKTLISKLDDELNAAFNVTHNKIEILEMAASSGTLIK